MVEQKIMEIDSSNLSEYIRVYDDILSERTLNVFLKICEENSIFNHAGLASKENNNPIDKKIRDVKSWPLFNIGVESRTSVFWSNYFNFVFRQHIKRYNKDIENRESNCQVNDIEVLKYVKNGKYTFHVDHGTYTPRTFSCIYLCNSNYEGGELCFRISRQTTRINYRKKIKQNDCVAK
jgi:hypothetical protein